MVISEATFGVEVLSARERSQYDFRVAANQRERYENDEPLVSAVTLKQAGLFVEPFWERRGDLEGDAYHMYAEAHGAFELSVRHGVYERLLEVQAYLPTHWRIVLKAGFRPLTVQYALLDIFTQKSRIDNPGWTDEQHLEHARTFVADPALVCPPHVTGGAIDVDVKNIKTGEYVDMGCPPNTDNEVSFLHSERLTTEQYNNRMILLDAMLAAGFAPNPHEWWHYQYGETYWAAFYGHAQTLYDTVTT